MSRTRIEVECQSWDEVDDALAKIGELDLQMKAEDLAAKREIKKIESGRDMALTTYAARRRELEIQIYVYMQRHRADFGKNKSKKLTYGTVDFRNDPSVVVERKGWTVGQIVAAIKERFGKAWKEYVTVKESLAKTKLRELSDEELAVVGLEKTEKKEKPGLKVDFEAVKRAMAQRT